MCRRFISTRERRATSIIIEYTSLQSTVLKSTKHDDCLLSYSSKKCYLFIILIYALSFSITRNEYYFTLSTIEDEYKSNITEDVHIDLKKVLDQEINTNTMDDNLVPTKSLLISQNIIKTKQKYVNCLMAYLSG